MTKKELIEKLKEFDDDTIITVMYDHGEFPVYFVESSTFSDDDGLHKSACLD